MLKCSRLLPRWWPPCVFPPSASRWDETSFSIVVRRDRQRVTCEVLSWLWRVATSPFLSGSTILPRSPDTTFLPLHKDGGPPCSAPADRQWRVAPCGNSSDPLKSFRAFPHQLPAQVRPP